MSDQPETDQNQKSTIPEEELFDVLIPPGYPAPLFWISQKNLMSRSWSANRYSILPTWMGTSGNSLRSVPGAMLQNRSRNI